MSEETTRYEDRTVLVRGDGSSNRTTNHYSLLSDYEPNKEDLSRHQASLGFHPHGYGGPMNIFTSAKHSGMYYTTWSSWASCD